MTALSQWFFSWGYLVFTIVAIPFGIHCASRRGGFRVFLYGVVLYLVFAAAMLFYHPAFSR